MMRMHAVLTTPTFEADAAEAGLGDDEIQAISGPGLRITRVPGP